MCLCTSQANNDDVDAAVAAAQKAQPKWAALSPHARARHMYALARHLQKHHRLMAVLETMDNGKPIRETRDADVPLSTCGCGLCSYRSQALRWSRPYQTPRPPQDE